MKKDFTQILKEKEEKYQQFLKELQKLQVLFEQIRSEALKLEGEIRFIKELDDIK